MAEELKREEGANPQSAAITGGVPAAAEPPPQTRGRAASAAASTYILLVLGVILLLTAVIADQESSSSIGMAVLGAAMIAIGVMSITGLLTAILVAVLGFTAGVLATIVAFSVNDFGYPQLILLVCGAASFIASFASLAAADRPGNEDEEPSAGVENV